MTGKAPDSEFDILWELKPGTEDVFPARQVILRSPEGEIIALPILEWMMEPEDLMKRLQDRGLEGYTPVEFYATKEEEKWVLKVISCLDIPGTVTGKETNWPPQEISTVVNVQVTPYYFRAVAKISFHYTLKQFPDLAGTESEFAPLRRVIREGEDWRHFVRQRHDQFVDNFRCGYRPTHWMHILNVERTFDSIISRCQFFAGPNSLPPHYEVHIGRNPARIDRLGEIRMHQFVYTDEPPSGFEGIMEDSQPLQRVVPV